MKRMMFFFVALVLCLSATALAQDGHVVTIETPTDIPSFIGYVENEFIIVFKHGMAPATVGRSPEGVPAIGVPDFDAIGRAYGVSRIKKQFRGARSGDLACYYKVKFTIGTLEQAMAAYRNHPLIDHVEPIGIHTTFRVPNDEFYPDQWHLNQPNDHDIDAPEAWDIETGSAAVTVAILDTGVRYFHKDLGGSDAPSDVHGNMWINDGEVNRTDGVDDDGNGYIDDWIGYDFVDGGSFCWSGEDCTGLDNDPRDFHGHGTHCSGIVSAITNNGKGVSGVGGGWDYDGIEQSTANGVKIMALRVGWAANYPLYGFVGLVRMDFAADAFYYAADNGAQIASCSWGSDNSGGLEGAVNYFLATGGLIFKAAGNADNTSADYLCGRSDVISVAATDQNDCKARFSSYGTWVDIAAPGVDIMSTHHDFQNPETDDYVLMSGTSMATPLVAGVAALVWSKEPTWTAEQVKTQLFATADNIDGLPCNSGVPSYVGKLGAGRVNAYNAVNTGGPQADFTVDPTSGCAPLMVYFTDQSTGDITGWSWDFDDDGEADFTGQNPPGYMYETAGIYTVTLTVTGPGGEDTETKTDYITVSDVPEAAFSADPTPPTGCAPLTVQFTDESSNNPTLWSWDFGDGVGTSSDQNPTYEYQDAGTYTVTLTASNACGLDDEIKDDYVQVDPPCDTIKAFALSDIPVKGTVTGSYTDTHTSNNVYETITERESGGKPSNRYSTLEHKWDFNVTSGTIVTFYVEAYRPDNSDGDDFLFEYSTDNATFIPLVTVDSAGEQTYSALLPNTLSGTVYIHVADTNHTPGNRSLDSVYIDSMYIESQQGDLPLNIITESLPGGTVNEYYSETVQAIGGTTPYTWTVIAGALPSGLALNPNTGEIYGTPDTEQTPEFTVQVIDADAATDTADLSITILAGAPPPEVSSCIPDSGGQNQRLTVTIAGENFQAGATVSFGEDITVQTTSVISSSEIVCGIKIAKKAAVAARDVVVTNPDEQSGTLDDGFSVTP